MERIRVASLQYFIRPVRSFEDFQDQVEGMIRTAAENKCRLVVFPEYFSIQLLTLGDVMRPIRDQVRGLTETRDRVIDVVKNAAERWQIYVAAGTIPTFDSATGKVHNECFFFAPNGNFQVQGKLHMTRFEQEEWIVHSRSKLKIFETDFGKVGVNICYDVEFPELARALAREGVKVLIVPSCTDDRQGFLRVRYCAQARAIENQLYVIHSGLVGSLPSVPAVSLNYGQASILTPSDFPFSRDGILAEGIPNQETMVIGELNLEIIENARESGTVRPLRDSVMTGDFIRELETVRL